MAETAYSLIILWYHTDDGQPQLLLFSILGDKGGKQNTTKIGALFGDVAHPNSPANISILALYIGDDNREHLEQLTPLWDQISQIKELCGFPVEFLLSADYKFICSFLGHQGHFFFSIFFLIFMIELGASSGYPCIYCEAQRPLPAVPVGERADFVPGLFNVTKAPLLPIPVSAIIPPSFHVLHGLGQRVIDIVEAEAKLIGQEEQLNAWIMAAKCKRKKRAQNYTGIKMYLKIMLNVYQGGEIHRLLTQPNPALFAELLAQSDKQLADLLLQLMGILRQFATLSKAKNLVPAEIDKLQEKGRRIHQLWTGLGTMCPSLHVTPKLHLLCAHIPQFARQRGWFAAISEQGVEHLHARLNQMERRFLNAGSEEGKCLQLVKHHILANHLHDKGMDPIPQDLESEEEEEEEANLEEPPCCSQSNS
jgi:hypothetical protein